VAKRNKGLHVSGRSPTSPPATEPILSGGSVIPEGTRIDVSTTTSSLSITAPHIPLPLQIVPDRTDFPAFNFVERGKSEAPQESTASSNAFALFEKLCRGQLTIPGKLIWILALAGAVFEIAQLIGTDNSVGKLESVAGLYWLGVKCLVAIGFFMIAALFAQTMLADISGTAKAGLCGTVGLVIVVAFLGASRLMPPDEKRSANPLGSPPNQNQAPPAASNAASTKEPPATPLSTSSMPPSSARPTTPAPATQNAPSQPTTRSHKR